MTRGIKNKDSRRKVYSLNEGKAWVIQEEGESKKIMGLKGQNKDLCNFKFWPFKKTLKLPFENYSSTIRNLTRSSKPSRKLKNKGKIG